MLCSATAGDSEVDAVTTELLRTDETEPAWLAQAKALRDQRPRHLLLLCVANSARSQMAEGIARALAAPGITISSAGSAPTAVRPEAVEVLREVGIDISGHHSKSVAEIPAESVDAVITLCAEEVCPIYLGDAHRLHWGLPDPAAVQGDAGRRLDAFRQVRDELRQRLAVLLGAEGGACTNPPEVDARD